MVGDTFENVASLQGCHFQQRDSVQTLGKILAPRKTVPAEGRQQSELEGRPPPLPRPSE